MFLFNDWEVDPRKHLYIEVFKKAGEWSDFVVVQHAVGILGHLFTRFRQKIWGLFNGMYRTKAIKENVYSFTPVIFFHYGIMLKGGLFSRLDAFLIQHQLNNFIKKKFSDRKIVLWLNMPHLYVLIKRVRHDYLVYDLQDNFDFNDDGEFSKKQSVNNEKIIMESDVVFCSAKIMFDRSISVNQNSYLINNGNDFLTLSRPVYFNIRTEISDIEGSIIGYHGGIRIWFDFELIDYLIKNLPDVNFVFIGFLYRNAMDQFKKIIEYPNVRWIQYKEHAELPIYLRRFDVGIIPFKINEFMKGVFPNKFYEYMACEVPIVTTPLPELEKFSDLIGFCRTKEDFLSKCVDAIDGKFRDKVSAYAEIAKMNSWKSRAVEMNSILKKTLHIN
jgi:glycosyltransferase involved in cell wall biosynthesis